MSKRQLQKIQTENGSALALCTTCLTSHFTAKIYNADEDTKRLAIFCENVDIITLHNKMAELGNFTYRLGINEYSDLVSN